MYCLKCGTELPEGAQFCPHCGNSISSPTAPPPSQNSNSPNPDVLSAEQQSTTPQSQPTAPPVTDEEIKCPKCGAVGCTPQYKQDVSGGGYGCCQGVLGSLILGPLGLLCGLCGRSVKTTNNLVWVCPKCGYEFKKPPSKEVMYKRLVWLVRLTAFFATCSVQGAVAALGSFYPDMIMSVLVWGLITAAVAYAAYKVYSSLNCTADQKQELKKNAVITGGIIMGILLLEIAIALHA